jgi:hypothetical protein
MTTQSILPIHLLNKFLDKNLLSKDKVDNDIGSKPFKDQENPLPPNLWLGGRVFSLKKIELKEDYMT